VLSLARHRCLRPARHRAGSAWHRVRSPFGDRLGLFLFYAFLLAGGGRSIRPQESLCHTARRQFQKSFQQPELTGLLGCAGGPFNVSFRSALGSFSLQPMSFGTGPFLSALLAGCCLAYNGCSPLAENQADEQKDPHFQTAKSRRRNLDFRGAIEAFEKA